MTDWAPTSWMLAPIYERLGEYRAFPALMRPVATGLEVGTMFERAPLGTIVAARLTLGLGSSVIPLDQPMVVWDPRATLHIFVTVDLDVTKAVPVFRAMPPRVGIMARLLGSG